MSLELPNPAIHREENFNDGLTALVIDRLRLGALHSPIFDEAELCPPNQLNGYKNFSICRDFQEGSQRVPATAESSADVGLSVPSAVAPDQRTLGSDDPSGRSGPMTVAQRPRSGSSRHMTTSVCLAAAHGSRR